MTEILVPNPLDSRSEEVEQRSQAAQALYDAATSFQITDPDSYAMAIEETKRLRTFVRSVKEWFKPMAEAANAVHKSITSRRAEITQPAEDAIGIYEKKVTAYRAEEERKARLAAEIERQRLEAEAKAKREAEALAAADRGDEDQFEVLSRMQSAPVPAAPVAKAIVEQRAPKLKGMVETRKWKARWASEHPAEMDECAIALCRAIADGHVAANLIEPDWDALALLGEATAGKAPVPGIEFYEEVKTTIKGGR